MEVRSIDLESKAQELSEEQLSSVSGGHKITKLVPVLTKSCATGKHLLEATITV